MATKFKTLNAKWILINYETERRLINLNTLSNICQLTGGIEEDAKYLISFAPNASIYSQTSDDPYSIWDIKFSGGKFILPYSNVEECNADFNELIGILDQS